MDGNTISNGFQGGLNKPRVQWMDKDSDGDLDLFLLDMDGYLRFYENKGNSVEHDFVLVTAHFQQIQKTGWFAFRDLDLDGDLDLVTQNMEALWGSYSGIRYYVNVDGIFSIESDTLFTTDGGPLLSNNQSTPTFTDIDNDGDEDFFTGNLDGTLSFYENTEVENGNPVFTFITDYWQNISIIGQGREPENDRHGASAITFIDLDGDSDFDLSWGDYYQQSVYIIWNIGSPETPVMNIENIEDQYPPFEPVQTAGQNMPTFADLDGDGDQDLFITVLSGAYGTQYVDNFIYYMNNGSATDPFYEFETVDFFQSLDLYTGTVVEHTDFDSDGDLDMFIGTEIDYSSTPFRGKILYYKNGGSSNNPVWILEDSDFLGTNLGYNLAPCFGDLDSDGDSDFLLGDYNGKIFVYIREGSEPDESSYEYTGELNDIDLSGRSHPELIDIDSDGDLDLFIGENWGVIHFYENTGTPENYEFTFITESYFDIDVGEYSAPEFSDVDNDGDFDLLAGSQEGTIHFFNNIGTNTNPNFQFDETVVIPYIGGSANISIGNFFGVGRKDMIAGLYTGGLYYLKRDTSENLGINDSQSVPVVYELNPAYPNPFNPVTTIRFSVLEFSDVNISIYDIQGRFVESLINEKLSPGNHTIQWNAEGMSSGVYFIQLQNSVNIHTQKIILLK